LEKYKILYLHQYGIRPNHSTTHAVLDITTTLYDLLNDKNNVCFLTIDLKKAFDTVSHQRLLLKLEHHGIRGMTHDLLKRYLTNRKQFVNLSSASSTKRNVQIGVHQGTILDPLLYNLYDNDFQNAVDYVPRLYADDTCLIVYDKSHERDILKTEFDKISLWMKANRLTINPQKSSILPISPVVQLAPMKLEVNINQHALKSCDTLKYLGIILDYQLNFKQHISKITKQVAKATGILWKARKFLPEESLLNLYHALIQPHLLYGIITWGSISPSGLLSAKQCNLIEQ